MDNSKSYAESIGKINANIMRGRENTTIASEYNNIANKVGDES